MKRTLLYQQLDLLTWLLMQLANTSRTYTEILNVTVLLAQPSLGFPLPCLCPKDKPICYTKIIRTLFTSYPWKAVANACQQIVPINGTFGNDGLGRQLVLMVLVTVLDKNWKYEIIWTNIQIKPVPFKKKDATILNFINDKGKKTLNNF